MKRFFFLRFILGFIALALSPLQAEQVVAYASEVLPESAIVIRCVGEALADNVCKWEPGHAPGARRNLGQRLVNGKEPVHVNRFILRVADIPGAVGLHATGAGFVLRLSRFETARDIVPVSPPVMEATGRFPEGLGGGAYLVFDFPAVELEPAGIYGIELGFQEPGEGHTLNFSTTHRDAYSAGRIFFHTNEPDAEEMAYILRSNNLIFYLGAQ